MGVYAIGKDNNYFETMTKEQIISAIQTAAAGGSLEGFNNVAFVSCIKETNKNAAFSVWVGTKNEYAAITPKKNTLYLLTDDPMREDLPNAVDALKIDVENQREALNDADLNINKNSELIKALTESTERLITETREIFKPQLLFENAAGAANAQTSELITNYDRIVIAYQYNDSLSSKKFVFQFQFCPAAVVDNNISTIAGDYFTYTGGSRKGVIGLINFGIENKEAYSNISATTIAANISDDATDFRDRFPAKIIRIYGIGKRV